MLFGIVYRRIFSYARVILLLFVMLSGSSQLNSDGIDVHAAPLGATLSIPSMIPANLGTVVLVVFRFQSFGEEVAGITFSIDYDPTCLAFDPTDSNNDHLPDAVTFALPQQFRGSVSFNSDDTDGELDFVIADFSLPLDLLVDTNSLITVGFTPICVPTTNNSVMTEITFSSSPSASFSDTRGQAIEGTVEGGSVVISPSAPTPIVIPNATPTATPLPTLTHTPTPSATHTPIATNTPTPTATTKITPSQLPVYLPLVRR